MVPTHAPQFRSKNVLFTFKLNLCHDYAAERSFHLLQLRFPCGWRVKISSLPSPFIFSSAQRESADSPFVFLPPHPSIRSKSKGYAGARNRFTFPALGYKSLHRHCILFIGQSFLCLLLLPAQKTLASSPSSRQMANNKRIGEGSSDAPPPLRPRLG